MNIMTHATFHFNWLILTLIFGIRASETPWAWRTTEKAGPYRVKNWLKFFYFLIFGGEPSSFVHRVALAIA